MKTLKAYKEEYQQAIKAATTPDTKYVVKENIWIYFKFTEDNGISPDMENFKSVIVSTKDYDPELCDYLIKAHYEVLAEINKRAGGENF